MSAEVGVGMGIGPGPGTEGNGLFEVDDFESPLASFVLNPRFLKTFNRSAFWTGFEREATKRFAEGDESTPV